MTFLRRLLPLPRGGGWTATKTLEERYNMYKTHLVLVHLFPGEVNKSHLDSFALDAVHEAVTDGAAHDEGQRYPGDEAGRPHTLH